MRNKKGQFVKGTHWRKKKPWWDYDWLYEQYITLEQSAQQIAEASGVTENNILYWLKKHNIPRRNMAEIRANKHWGSAGVDNPMWNRKGELNPNWKGGITPLRQLFYVSREWKKACSQVWKRDKATCQRCGLPKKKNEDMPFHIHHIVTFADEDLRADVDNLVLLCEPCHHFVHSRGNVNNEYLPQE